MNPTDFFEARRAAEALGFGPVVQIALHAPHIEREALSWVRRGAGPFFLLEHVPLARCLYRGAPTTFDHSSAYGQCGEIMLELIHQHDDSPSPVRDMFDRSTSGTHHAAVFVDNLVSAASRAKACGFAIALDATTTTGVRFLMADARAETGAMLELYEPSTALLKFYAFVRAKSQGFTGADPLRRL